MGDWLFELEFSPRLKPGEAIQIKDEFYEVEETRPMAPWEFKLTNITMVRDVDDLRVYGLKPGGLELLNYRLKIMGPVRVAVRIEGAGGLVYGGWGAGEKAVDERYPANLLEFMQFGERVGWLHLRVYPLVTPAWLKLRAEGYVYVLRRLPTRPPRFLVPPFIRR
jgi:hypothetical protein